MKLKIQDLTGIEPDYQAEGAEADREIERLARLLDCSIAAVIAQLAEGAVRTVGRIYSEI